MQPFKETAYRLLRWSEKYTKTDMVYLASGGFWSALATILSALIALATATAFSHLLPKTTYGTYQYVLSAVTILGILGLPGLKTAISYASARGADGSFLDAIQTKIKWNTLSAVGAFCLGIYYFSQGNMLLTQAFFVAAIFFPWWDVYGNYVPYLQGKKRFAELTMYELGTQAINAIAIIFVIRYTDNLTLLCLAFFASWTAGRLFFYKKALRLMPPNETRDPSVMSYAKHLSLMSVVGAVANNADKFVLWHFLGPIEVAVYTFALAIPQRAVGAFASINRLYFPKAAEQDSASVQKTLMRKIGLLSILTFITTGAYVLVAESIFQMFFPQYIEAVPYTQAIALLIALQPTSLIATMLGAHARKKDLYLYNVLPPLVQIGLFLALIPTLHIWGAVVALIVAQSFESVLLVILFVRRTPTNS